MSPTNDNNSVQKQNHETNHKVISLITLDLSITLRIMQEFLPKKKIKKPQLAVIMKKQEHKEFTKNNNYIRRNA